MIAIDTNILLRRLLEDEPRQLARVRRIFDTGEAILVTDVVLVETVWTLTGKRYRATRDQIAAVVTGLLQEPNILFEDRQAVWSALNDYLETTAAGFADALVVNKSRQVAAGLGDALRAVYTFDQAALDLAGTVAP